MSISKDAKLISTTFSELRDMGFIVNNLNTYRKMQRSMNRLCDLIIIGKTTGVHFIEVKLTSTKDTAKPNQKDFADVVSHLSNQTDKINYWVIHNLDEAYAVFDFILHGTQAIGDINGTTEQNPTQNIKRD